ncbi:hypothetical protein O181_018092 [Austropuccinia psidii MF-1]|uniref:Uncharacterized protein n=1 Tax=Austropuccinia psidii MF-1 TaxID=1389203 RepID=A0A9Q3GT66_9BASI|nr:hypothetical protein [Austropuccinia psidii MF-1]
MATTDKKEAQFTEFVLSIPPDKNPFFVVREYVGNMMLQKGIPKWAYPASYVILVILVIMFLESLYILFVMVFTKSFTLATKTSLGLWKLDTINMYALLCCLHSIVSIYDWVLEQFFSAGFVWATVCHGISIFWAKHNGRKKFRFKATQNPFPSTLRWICHFFFILPLLIFFAVAFVVIVGFHTAQLKVENVAKEMQNSLQKAGEAFNREQYMPDHVLQIMHRANEMKRPLQKILQLVKVYQVTFLSAEIFVMLIYVPFMLLSWRDLRVKSKLLAAKLRNSSGVASETLNELQEVVNDTRVTLFYRSLPLLFDLLASIPGLFWIIHNKKDPMFRNGVNYAITKMVFTLPIPLGFDLHLLVVALHCKKRLNTFQLSRIASRQKKAQSIITLNNFNERTLLK